jgi:hypothetical protein
LCHEHGGGDRCEHIVEQTGRRCERGTQNRTNSILGPYCASHVWLYGGVPGNVMTHGALRPFFRGELGFGDFSGYRRALPTNPELLAARVWAAYWPLPNAHVQLAVKAVMGWADGQALPDVQVGRRVLAQQGTYAALRTCASGGGARAARTWAAVRAAAWLGQELGVADPRFSWLGEAVAALCTDPQHTLAHAHAAAVAAGLPAAHLLQLQEQEPADDHHQHWGPRERLLALVSRMAELDVATAGRWLAAVHVACARQAPALGGWGVVQAALRVADADAPGLDHLRTLAPAFEAAPPAAPTWLPALHHNNHHNHHHQHGAVAAQGPPLALDVVHASIERI